MRFLLLLLFALPALSQPVPHAVLDSEGAVIPDELSPYGIRTTLIDPGLVSAYRETHPAKVGNLRLLVVPERPEHTLQQTVEPNEAATHELWPDVTIGE